MKKIRAIIFAAFCLFGCKKDPVYSPPPPAQPPPLVIKTTPVIVSVDSSRRGSPIPANFEGLSFETAILVTSPAFLNADNKVLVQLIKNLGPGILRIGGHSSDEINWEGDFKAVSTATGPLTAGDVDRLAGFSEATGWSILFGLNMSNTNAVMAAEEAKYVAGRLKNNLYAFESGNEPDVYNFVTDVQVPAHNKPGAVNPFKPHKSKYNLVKTQKVNFNFTGYRDEWDLYHHAVSAVVPKVAFAGPDVSYNSDWVTAFARDEHSYVKLIDAHYYVDGPATDASINYFDILDFGWKLNNLIEVISTDALKYHLPYRISECNTVYDGGKPGVSDVFASALSALDFMWTIAKYNGDGINFHGGTGLFYSPLFMENGILVAKPEYYAMLAFKYAASGGTSAPLTLVNNRRYNCSAYACTKADNSLSFTLINKEDRINIPFTINVKNKTSVIKIVRLTAPALNATSGTAFAGSIVSADGSFQPRTSETYSIDKNSFVVNVPAGSAAVVTVQ